VLADIAGHAGCHLLPPAGQPILPGGFVLPGDLRRFYELCGGAVLFEGAAFAWKVSAPNQLVPASPRLLGPSLAEQIAGQQPDELTNRCFVFAASGDASTDSLVIVDLHPARAGKFYDGFWDSYGVVGQMPILATTVANLVGQLLDTRGLHVPHPPPGHGDAYDEYQTGTG
jgi:antitoxin YokJ